MGAYEEVVPNLDLLGVKAPHPESNPKSARAPQDGGLTQRQIEEADEEEALRDKKKAEEAEAERAREREESERRKAEQAASLDLVANLMKSRVVGLLGWIVGTVVGVYLFVNFLSVLRLAADPNVLVRCGAWAFIAMLAVAVGACFWKARSLYVALPKFDQQRYDKGKRMDAVIGNLRTYLKNFPEESKDLVRLDTDKICLSEMIAGLREKPSSNEVEEEKWMAAFCAFQNAQEEIAAGVVKRWAKLIGVKTAACPWQAGDVLIFFVNTTFMITEIARIFNRRVEGGVALRFAMRFFVQLYVVGRTQEFAEAGAGAAVDGAASFLDDSETWGDVLQTSAPILKKVLGKGVEGFANGYMAYRLGKKAIESFRALCPR